MSLNSRAILTLIALAGSSLSGCMAFEQPAKFEPVPRLRTERWANQVALQPQGLLFAPNAPGLSAAQYDALRQLVADWRSAGSGSVLVENPGGAEATATTDEVAQILRGMGLSDNDVRSGAYDPSAPAGGGVERASGGRAPVRISFLRYMATPAECGRRWDSITATFSNTPYYNFGCAVNANAAVQTADARDLAGPRPSTPADAARRQVVLDKYRAGEVTSSAKDDQASGAISSVAKQ